MAHAQTTPAPSDKYYVPHSSPWPIVGAAAMFTTVGGAAMWINGANAGPWTFIFGLALLATMFIGWFGAVIRESEGRLYNEAVDRSFRMGMMWFIFSEVMFFAAFFGALFYARQFALPWLSGEGDGALTNQYLWPGYSAGWPTNGPGQIGGSFQTISAWGLPLVNTLLLLSSGVTITIAHHALKANKRGALIFWLAATIALGAIFLCVQGYEYYHAYHELGLTLGSGIYGSTFFMLTGFHGMHVFLGTVMLIVIWLRCVRGHFSPDHHFGFEAVAWYWHFVDVVWLGLFLFVYVL